MVTDKSNKHRHREVKVPLKTVVDLLPASIYWQDRKMVFLGCNSYQAKLIGLKTPEDIIGKTLYDYNSKQAADALVKNNLKVMRLKQTFRFEEERICPDGSKEIYASQKSPLFDERGRVIGLLGISFNITEQKEIELSKDTVLEEIITNLPGNVYWKNRQGVYLGCNANIAKMIGLSSPAEIIGKTIQNIYPELPEVALHVAQSDEEVMQNNQAIHFEEKGVDVHKVEAFYITHKVPLLNQNGKVNGMLGLSFDITRRKKAEEALKIAKEEAERAKEEAERANKAKSEFMEFMTHELRTPLTGMLGTLHNLAKHPEKTIKESEHMLKNIQLSGELLLAHINDILDYAKLRKEQFEFYPSQFDLKDSILSTAELLTPNAAKKNIKILVRYPTSLPHSFYADKNRVNQILFNLMGNAVKFTQKGKVRVFVKCLSQNKKDAVMKISVSDTGPGIPKDKYETIFNKFEQLESSRSPTEHQQGTGLGLAIVRKLMNKFKGKIELKSKVGKGSHFHITLPLSLKPPYGKKHNIIKPRQKSLSRCILLAEDNKINQEVIKDMLQDLKCQVLVASTGKETLKLFKKHPIDVVFLDIHLPDTDGYTLAKKIRHKSPEIPIVVLTANASSECKARCKKMDIPYVLSKPINFVELESALKHLLG